MNRINCAWCKGVLDVSAEDSGNIVVCGNCKKQNKIYIVARARKWFSGPPTLHTTFATSFELGNISNSY